MNTAFARLKENQFDVVHDSQQIFRTLVIALAFPGTVRKLKSASLAIDRPRIEFILQPFLTLLDFETNYCVVAHDKALQEEVSQYIEINTNSHPKQMEQADFVLCLEAGMDGNFAKLKRGTLPHPDHSTTIFYLVEEICSPPQNKGVTISLSGPGIEEEQSLSVNGLALSELEQWRECRHDYPMGIDIYLVSWAGSIIGIPRSSTIRF
jgi:alpha-D-ribose 1-methylphosphonate 5-triphosphate synthase subunit PhnH